MFSIYMLSFLIELVSALFWSFWATALTANGFPGEQTGLALAIFFIAQALFEVPTGIAADAFGKKRITVAGIATVGLGYLAASSSNLVTVSIGFSAVGIGLTMMSGAKIAWFYGLMSQRQSEFRVSESVQRKFFLDLNLIGRVATIIGAFGGVAVIERTPKLFWLTASLLALLACFVACFLETDRVKPLNSSITRVNISGLLHGTAFFFVLLSVLFFGVEAGVRNLINQPYVLELSGSNFRYLAYFQVILAVARLLGIFFFRLIHSSFLARSYILSLVLPLLVFAVSQWMAIRANSFWSFIPLYALSVFMLGWYFPVREAFVNSLLTDSSRATFLSVESMIMNLASGLVLLFIYPGLHFGSVARFWAVGAIALVLSAFALAIAVFSKKPAA